MNRFHLVVAAAIGAPAIVLGGIFFIALGGGHIGHDHAAEPHADLAEFAYEGESAPTSRPMERGALRNPVCPITGEATSARHYFAYNDAEGNVFARIYARDEAAVEAIGADPRGAYEKAFLQRTDPESGAAIRIEYGQTRLKVKNQKCPVSGERAIDSASMSFNYNAVAILNCCPGCEAEFLSDPDKYLHNVSPETDKAQEEARRKEGAGS